MKHLLRQFSRGRSRRKGDRVRQGVAEDYLLPQGRSEGQTSFRSTKGRPPQSSVIESVNAEVKIVQLIISPMERYFPVLTLTVGCRAARVDEDGKVALMRKDWQKRG